MMNPNREKRGQFVIIAIMLTAIMIVSIGALMHNAITYYKHEPWEEYSTLVGDIEINSRKLIELSLASYTNGKNTSKLSDNLENWKNDLKNVYPGSGIALTYSAGEPSQGSTSQWGANFMLNITSIGLKGYKFSVKASLSLSIGAPVSSYNITAFVATETGEPLMGLGPDNFLVNGVKPTAVAPIYVDGIVKYGILVHGAALSPVEVWDQRGIRAQV